MAWLIRNLNIGLSEINNAGYTIHMSEKKLLSLCVSKYGKNTQKSVHFIGAFKNNTFCLKVYSKVTVLHACRL